VRRLRVVGVMTGTSCDGLDAVCIEIDAAKWISNFHYDWKVLWQKSVAYPNSLRKRVISIQQPDCKQPLKALLELDRDLGSWYGKSLAKILSAITPHQRPHLIANHGQTIGHFPSSRHRGTTFQIGDPTRIAHSTNVTVVAGFRKGDMAAGGQGAPLVPLFHKILADKLAPRSRGICIHNIGGISNLTYIGEDENHFLAFDTGPGNIWIDLAAEKASRGRIRMDKNGKLARKGRVDYQALKQVLKHPFFKTPPPRSTGRDDFPFALLLKNTHAKGNALVATATAITVETIAGSYERWIIKRGWPLETIYLCGGGAKNPTLVQGLKERLPGITVKTSDEAGLNSKYIEAQAFALFGFLALIGRPVGGKWTGAKGFGPPAHIIPGKNWLELIAKIRSSTR